MLARQPGPAAWPTLKYSPKRHAYTAPLLFDNRNPYIGSPDILAPDDPTFNSTQKKPQRADYTIQYRKVTQLKQTWQHCSQIANWSFSQTIIPLYNQIHRQKKKKKNPLHSSAPLISKFHKLSSFTSQKQAPNPRNTRLSERELESELPTVELPPQSQTDNIL